ncbi:hypothetical protein PspTeo4_10664 [Pseudomonas sp. Teo4]|nr:hypothetical protein [Pseudomonas sp. Teo4]
MVRLGAQALHGFIAQARAQAFAQLLPGLRLLGAGVKQGLVLGHEWRQVIGDQAQVAHRRRNAQRLQAPTGQLEQHASVALGGQQADLEQGVRPLGMLQVQAEALHATVPASQERGQVVQHAP